MADSNQKFGRHENKEIGFGLVGTGTIASSHIQAIHANDGAKLVGVFSETSSRGRELAERYGIHHYSTYTELLEDDRVDIVDIANKTNLHAEYALRAVEQNKHVLVEKPIDADLDKAEKLVNLAEENHRKLSCVSEFRFSPGIMKLKELLETKALGEIHVINVSIPLFRTLEYYTASPWRSKRESAGGGVLAMNAIHVLDILLWLFGPGREVTARKRILRENIEVEDCAAVLMQFESNTLCVMTVTNAAGKTLPLRIEMHGRIGSVELEDFVMVNRLGLHMEPLLIMARKIKNRLLKGRSLMNTCYYHQIKDILDAVKEDKNPLTSGDSGRRALALLNRIYGSCESR